MMRPPFRPPLSHEPGTDPDHLGKPHHNGHTCCGRPGCCGGGHENGQAANSTELNSVAPTHSACSNGKPAKNGLAPVAKAEH